MQKTFDTVGPISLYLEIGSGDITVQAAEVTATDIIVTGRDADDVVIEQHGDQISVVAPPRRTGFLNGSSDLNVNVTLPMDSNLGAKLGSTDITAAGRYGSARIKSGSGDVQIEALTEDAVIQTGSGDVQVGSSLGDLRIKCGSGDVKLGRLAATAVISTGSGDVSLDSTEEDTVVKSGSGDVHIKQAHTDISLTSASGDLYVDSVRRGSVKAKAVSGDVHIGVPAGIPVWTDISCVTGSVRSNLNGAGQPEQGQDYIEIRATTVSGDIDLAQL